MNRNPHLPKSSRQETLETISRNKLALLFDPELFELRPENQRDKGIDLIGEIKQDGIYTNFRFAIQVKSTESVKKLRDGSISYPVETSNLNYLLNFGLPAYYILYDLPGDSFYIATVAEVYHSLMTKHKPGCLPKNYTIKFKKILDRTQLDAIYKETFENGILLQKLGTHLRVHRDSDQPARGFVIDEQRDVYSVEQNIEFIEQVGYELLNRHAFTQIMEIEQRTQPRGKVSPTFNMVCGLAYYHGSNLFRAVELLKLAHNESDQLHPEDKSMLRHTLARVRYMLGLLSEPDFRKETAEIVKNEGVGTFLQLENLYNQFMQNRESEQGARIGKYYAGAMQIIAKRPEFHDMRVVAYAKILNLESTLLLHELAKNSLMSMGRKTDTIRDQLETDWLKFDEQFLSQLQQLYGYALKHQNFLALSNLIMQKIDWEFAKVYHFYGFNNWNKATLMIDGKVAEEDVALLLDMLTDLDKVIGTYDRLHHRENHFNCLRCKYEILDFLGRPEDAEVCVDAMKGLIDAYELNALRKRLDQLLQGQMKHRTFLSDLAQRKAGIDRVARDSGIYEQLYCDLNEEMNSRLNRKPEWSITELLPLTYPADDTSVIV
ncbi:uncharacterized protein DUF4365 [Mucilaginibacter gracilis]|uniref:Uncharacterized protein DUF4365 n=1 Tax=Mucilaginibacter gracilis TaxID=423350 RepID=A0A495J1D6_9SPHI|nr:DUF4365 domain-containing protein [Mucilaginibacter gracilis]RKR82148.1 uncharacterized protein DUF4365 [Mucilaginibacter gracilis]